jgi:hypothetical protein
MKKERLRQAVTGPLAAEEMKARLEKGWKLVAVEWERDVEATEAQIPGDVPFGLKVEPETARLEENAWEKELLFQMMELMVEEGSYARIAEEINRRGFRTRDGGRWTPISVFEMLPRLIEVGPHVFRSAEWQKRTRSAPKPH